MAFGAALKSVFTRFTFSIDGGKLAAINATTGKAVTNLSLAAKQAAALKTQTAGFLGGIKSFVAVAAGGMLLRGITTGFARGADQIAKFSKATGVATDTYQGLIHAASLSGVTQEEVNKSLLQLSRRAHDAQRGMKETKDAFEEAKVEYKDTNGELLNGDRILLNLANRWKEMPDGATKTALAMKLMGRTGARLNVLLNEGGEGIRAYIEDAKKLGIVLSQKSLADAEKFNDEMLRTKSVFIGLRNQIAIRILPAITKAMTAFVDWTRRGNNARHMLTALKIVAMITTIIIANIIRGFILKQWTAFIGILGGVVKMFRALNVQAAIAIEDLVVFARGGDSIMGRILGDDKETRKALQDVWSELKAGVIEVKKSLDDMWKSAQEMATAFGVKLPSMKKTLKIIAKVLLKGVVGALIIVLKLLSASLAILGLVFKGVAGIARLFKDVWIGALDAIENELIVISDIFEDIGTAGRKVAESIGAAFKKAADLVKDEWREVQRGFKLFISVNKKLFGKTKEFFGVGGEQPVISPPKVPAGAAAPPRPASTGAAASQASINIREMNINGTDLGPEELAGAVKKGLRDVFNGAIRDMEPAEATA